jgi:hypothetical protein
LNLNKKNLLEKNIKKMNLFNVMFCVFVSTMMIHETIASIFNGCTAFKPKEFLDVDKYAGTWYDHLLGFNISCSTAYYNKSSTFKDSENGDIYIDFVTQYLA